MTKTVEYYFTCVSPWTYLGHARFVSITKKHGATVAVKPADLGKVFPVSGGLPLAKRAPQRQAYRMMELKRWRTHLGLPLNLQPKYFPVSAEPSALMVIAAIKLGMDAMTLAGAFMKACWAEERDVSDPETLSRIAKAGGFDEIKLASEAAKPTTKAEAERLTQEAIDRGVFGAPTYAYKDELFWGQDRLDFLDRALANS